MEEFSYEDTSSKKTKNIVIGVVLASVGVVMAIVAIFEILSWDKNKDKSSLSINYLTYSNYQKIQNGMTYDEVVEIFDGHEGVLDTSSGFGDYTLEYYTWESELSARFVIVGFENGYVCSKTQNGLR